MKEYKMNEYKMGAYTIIEQPLKNFNNYEFWVNEYPNQKLIYITKANNLKEAKKEFNSYIRS